jgi:transcriptional regulator with XRE-family HTH domain
MVNLLSTKQLILKEMERRGIDQKEIADILGVSPPYVNQIIKDKKRPEKRLFEFAEKLGVNLFDGMSVCDVNCSPEITLWCKKVKKILESKTKYTDALKENIDAFLMSIEAKEEAEARMRDFEDNIQTQIETMKIIHEQEIDKINADWNKKLEKKFKDHQNKFNRQGLSHPTDTVEGDGSQ